VRSPTPSRAEPQADPSAGAPAWSALLRRLRADPLVGFWVGVGLVGVVTALSLAAEAAGPGAAAQVRVFGWPALGLPLALFAAGLRRRAAGRQAPGDRALLALSGLLVLTAVFRMHLVLGALLGLQ
jgi:hypothetical protein